VIYEFGVFSFDEATLELRKTGRVVPLEPQPAKALALLLARAGIVVTREELAAHVWGEGTHVDFNRGLAYCLSQVRAALGDSGESPRFVQTLPKRGFKFVAPTAARISDRAEGQGQRADEPGLKNKTRPTYVGQYVGRVLLFGPAGRLSLAAAALIAIAGLGIYAIQWSGRPVVAVSIFDNETGDPKYDRPVHAIADTVVDRLTALGPDQLGVVGNASVLRIPRNERDLERIKGQTGASHVILAQLQPRQQELSLLIHLIRLDDGTHLWTRRIPRPTADALQGLDEEAAALITTGIQAHVLD
jgi:DNA-binding winged helix-turn-helix (wHTH) protein/TolB-like protein